MSKCTASKVRKVASFGPETTVVPVRMYGNSTFPLQQIPPELAVNPNNHTLDRRNKTKKKVQIQICSDTAKIKARICLSEHPFGTLKWYYDARHVLCKGKKKASGELGLSFLVNNLKRALSLVGARELKVAMKS